MIGQTVFGANPNQSPEGEFIGEHRTHSRWNYILASFLKIQYTIDSDRSVAQPGRALSSGGRGREFESRHSDQSDRLLVGSLF